MHCMSVADPASGRRTPRERDPADPGGGVPGGAVPHVAPTHTPAGPRRASARTNRKRVTAAPAARTATGCGRRPARSVYTKDRTLRPRYIMRVFFTLEDLIRYRQSRRSELRARH